MERVPHHLDNGSGRPGPLPRKRDVLWAALALLLLGHCACWAAEEDPADRESPVSIYFIAPFATPWLIAYDMRREGFTSYPYDRAAGYGQGERSWAMEAGESVEFTGSARAAQNIALRGRGSRGLGLDATFSTYSRGSFGRQTTSGFYRGNLTANYLQSDKALLDFGMGVGVFQAPQSSWGPTWDLNLELFPNAPWSFRARYELALLGSRPYHEFTFGAGYHWNRFMLGAGFRSLLNHWRNTGGPEVTAQVYF